MTEGGKKFPIFGTKLVAKTATIQFGIRNWRPDWMPNMPLPPVVPAPVPPRCIARAIVRAGEGVLEQGPVWFSLHIAVIEPYLHPVHQDVRQRDAGAMPMDQYQNVPRKQSPTIRPVTALVNRGTTVATSTAGSFARFGCRSLSHCWAS